MIDFMIAFSSLVFNILLRMVAHLANVTSFSISASICRILFRDRLTWYKIFKVHSRFKLVTSLENEFIKYIQLIELIKSWNYDFFISFNQNYALIELIMSWNYNLLISFNQDYALIEIFKDFGVQWNLPVYCLDCFLLIAFLFWNGFIIMSSMIGI